MGMLQKILLHLKGNGTNKIWFKVPNYFFIVKLFIAPNVPNIYINN